MMARIEFRERVEVKSEMLLKLAAVWARDAHMLLAPVQERIHSHNPLSNNILSFRVYHLTMEQWVQDT